MRLILGVAFALVLAGPCTGEAVQVVLPPPLPAQSALADPNVQPVSLTRLAANIAPGTPWIQDYEAPYFMLPCAMSVGITQWREEDNKNIAFDSFNRIFVNELKAAGFRISGDTTNLFEDQKSADLQIGALVTAVRVRTCKTASPTFQIGGSGTVDIEWQVYSVTQAKVVARIATKGGYVLRPTREGLVRSIVTEAFADNVRRLTADAEFRRIVTSAPSARQASPPPAEISFSGARPAPVPLGTAVKSVVTIYAGDGSGSGVVISADGYILTNHHVAGSSGQVRIHWADGADTIGEVVRGDPRRDVALIKTTSRSQALPIRQTPAQLGETVFAVGTPLSKEFANTLTRGVISATRQVDGQALIQSDVAVDHGNSGGPLLDEQGRIVALTVSGYQPDNVSHNINFFIPIEDALRALALKPAA